MDQKPNYWQKYGPRGRPTSRPQNGQVTPMRRLDNWQENYHNVQAKCPACDRWKYMRVIQDRWVNNLIRKLRLQCECGFVFTHDETVHDHVLERVPGTGTGRRGTYKPRGWTPHRTQGRVYRD